MAAAKRVRLVISQLYSSDTANEAKEISVVQHDDLDMCQVKFWLEAETNKNQN